MLYYFLYILYITSLGLITLYCIGQFVLYLHSRKYEVEDLPMNDKDILPPVTIQLPIYNEQYVVERLIDRVCALDYPQHLLEIQVLDDSTDETVEIIARKLAYYRKQGINISHIHREKRKGYKAGALEEGLSRAQGDFIAIFDADFLPTTDFLLRTIPFFCDEHIGVVQTRWGHINQEYSLLTRMQAFHLNVHFNIEQTGRQSADAFLQFNGTGGIWRKECINQSGGWASDTLTEDLDLSYRAQLHGWKIHYLRDCACPAELPVEMQGLKSQQFRWMKGGAETARKLLPRIVYSDISPRRKLHSLIHLFSSSVFVLLLFGMLSSTALLFMDRNIELLYFPFLFFSVGFILLAYIYFCANLSSRPESPVFSIKGFNPFILKYPLFLSLSMGMSLHNTIAVIEGFLGVRTPFIRTPKYAITTEGHFHNKAYKIKRIPFTSYLEIVLAMLFSAAFIYGVYTGNYVFIFFHLMAAIGFACIAFYSVKHSLKR